MAFNTKDSSIGVKVKSLYAPELPHGSVVSYCPERRIEADGYYGVLDVESPAPVFLWPGLNTGFGIDVEEAYEEIQHNPAFASTDKILERVRNAKTGEELGFSINVVPQMGIDFPLLEFITGSPGGAGVGLGDEPDSTSWMKELNGHFSLYTGIMFEDYKLEIPALGVAKESITGFAGHREAIRGTSWAINEAGEADDDKTKPITWSDIEQIRMDATDTPTTEVLDCVSDISFGFTSEIKKETHPESLLSTKIANVRVVSRKMFVSLKLGYVSEAFLSVVEGEAEQNLKLIIGESTHETTMLFTGLHWPKYVARATPKELIGDTITCIVDQPDFKYVTA